MDAAKAVENLQSCPIGQLPANEAQARPLAALEPEQQRQAWKRVVEDAAGGAVTAAVAIPS